MKKIIYLFFLIAATTSFGFANNTSGFHFDRSKPVEITADRLVIDGAKNEGQFSGNVNIRQSDFHLSSDKVTVIYDKEKKEGQNSQIEKIIAIGNVHISSLEEKAKSNKAIYDVVGEKITLNGNILITREEGVLSGDIATINLKTRYIDIKSYNNKRIYSIIHLKK